jgi:penicillin amidase
MSASDWTGMRPVSSYPQAVNPAQGFLASANQQPIDPAVDPTYIGSNWYPPWRAMRINQLLRADSAVTVDAMRQYQTDPGSPRADLFVPRFLAAARRASSDSVARAAALLAEWDRRYTVDNERAVLFEYAMSELTRTVWDELQAGSGDGRGAPRPSETILVELLEDSVSVWWDVLGTPVIERRDEVLRASLLRALERAEREHGDPERGGWRWSGIQRANVRHLAGIPGFAAPPVAVQGGPSTLNPVSGSGTFGASWRMVVELGDEVRAWGTYPGGQSGNPLSNGYDDRIATWAAGRLDVLEFPRNAEAMSSSKVRGTLTLVPGR